MAYLSEKYFLVRQRELYNAPPGIQGKNVRVWNIRQDNVIRINLVEMSGELGLHQHPDAEHSLLLLEGQVRVQIDGDNVTLNQGDYISIPAGIAHKYWSLTPTSLLVSMDAPFYDPEKTINLE
jgi:quercetin dioxygenase-like cupin family protein